MGDSKAISSNVWWFLVKESTAWLLLIKFEVIWCGYVVAVDVVIWWSEAKLVKCDVWWCVGVIWDVTPVTAEVGECKLLINTQDLRRSSGKFKVEIGPEFMWEVANVEGWYKVAVWGLEVGWLVGVKLLVVILLVLGKFRDEVICDVGCETFCEVCGCSDVCGCGGDVSAAHDAWEVAEAKFKFKSLEMEGLIPSKFNDSKGSWMVWILGNTSSLKLLSGELLFEMMDTEEVSKFLIWCLLIWGEDEVMKGKAGRFGQKLKFLDWEENCRKKTQLQIF